MRIGSLFSGIGGLELGLEWAGVGDVVWQVEQNEFCRRVLARHWPDVERYEDVEEVGAKNLASVDLICGGFPCQDISSAGKGAGLAGSRSGLWFEYARIINELRPEWVVIENVASGARRWVDAVCTHLGQLGYETLPVPLSAKDVGAPHLRKRIFLIAHAKREHLRIEPRGWGGARGQGEALAAEHGEAGPTTDAKRLDGGSRGSGGWDGRPPEPTIRRVDDGLSERLGNRAPELRALGNAVVPQCAEVIGYMIREMAGTLD